MSCSDSEEITSKNLPNIVLIFTDDQSYNTIHALGNETIHTPNLDRLVASGTTFTHAYNMGAWGGAVCVASRAMMISGRYVWQAKEIRQRWSQADSIALMQTWPKLLSQQGYTTYMCGKWHVPVPAAQLFDSVRNVRPGMPADAWAKEQTWHKIKDLPANQHQAFEEAMPVGYNRPIEGVTDLWSPSDTSFGGFWEGGKHWSEVVREDAETFIGEAQNNAAPFFMYLAFNAPHDPRQAPQPFVNQYKQEEIPVPQNWLPEYPWMVEIGCGRPLRDEALGPYPRTEYAIQKNIQEYYASITHLDEQVGAILDALEQAGKMENTYIFFTADHGLAVGQHGLFGKQNMYDHSMRVPLIVVGPDIPKSEKNNADVYLQDVMASSLELADIEQPDYVQFNSLLSLAKKEQTQSNYHAIYGSYMNHQRMIRKDNYKLIVYPDVPKLRLYDLENDPLEMKDLADSSQFQEQLDMLFNDLLALQKETKDTLDISALKTLISI